MKPFHFHPEAFVEADEASKFYEDRQKGDQGRSIWEQIIAIMSRLKTANKVT